MILGISGSPTPGSSTDVIVREAMKGALTLGEKAEFYRLSEMKILPCQACGRSPEPAFCFFHDDALMLMEKMCQSRAVIIGSPVFFDSVSAQTKLFIDRGNCLRPPDFSVLDNPRFKSPLLTAMKGGIVLVGGRDGRFDAALRTMRAFFIWAGIQIKFELQYRSKSFDRGQAASDNEIMTKAIACGRLLND